MVDRTRNRRSLMMHPALAVERWDEAMRAGADMVCFDLEDGTAPARKDEARLACLPCFARPAPASVLRLLRINAPRTAHGMRDILALLEFDAPPDGIVIPKVKMRRSFAGCASAAQARERSRRLCTRPPGFVRSFHNHRRT